MGNVSPVNLLIIALIVLLIFGAGRISEIGKGLGEGIKNFKKGLREDDNDDDEPKRITEGTKKRSKSAKAPANEDDD